MMVDVPILQAVITPPGTGAVQRQLGARVFEPGVSVKDFGALGDGSTDDTVALQAAIAHAFGSPNGHLPSTGGIRANKTLFFPPGEYKITAPLTIFGCQGIQMIGSGRLATKIKNYTNNSKVIWCDGVGYGYFQGIDFEGTGTGEAVFDLNWDGNIIGVGQVSTQANIFLGCQFAYGKTGCQVGRGYSPAFAGQMGSENVFIHCYAFGCFEAGFSFRNFNALQNQFFGGQCQLCADKGIWVSAGSVTNIAGTAFQAGNGVTNTADIAIDAQADDGISVTGCRSESYNFLRLYSGMHANVAGCSHVGGSTDGITGDPNSKFIEFNDEPRASVTGCVSTWGKIKAQQTKGQIYVGQCEFGRNDWHDITFLDFILGATAHFSQVEYNTTAAVSTPSVIKDQWLGYQGLVGNALIASNAKTCTIAAGVITPGATNPVSRWTKVAVETGTTDDLDTVAGTNFTIGDEIMLSTATAGHTITIKNGTGNIKCGTDFALTNVADRWLGQWDGTNWLQIGRNDNA